MSEQQYNHLLHEWKVVTGAEASAPGSLPPPSSSIREGIGAPAKEGAPAGHKQHNAVNLK